MSQKNLLYTSLTPSLSIEVPKLSQEGSFICVLGISNLHISTIFLLNAGTVLTFFHFIIPGVILMTVIQNSYANTVASFFLAKFNHSIEEILVSQIK
jgi:hypothetical protein